MVETVFPIELPDVQRTKEILHGGFGVSARDALHIAVMERHGVERIMSFDVALDRFPGIARVR